MEPIDLTHLDAVIDDPTSLTRKSTQCPTSMLQFFYLKKNLFYFVRDSFTLRELAMWIFAMNHFIDNKNQTRVINYKPREIVLVEHGANFAGEASYYHPAIIVKEYKDKVFVVPCSSGQLSRIYDPKGDIYPEYLIGEVSDGFSKRCVITVTQSRWISKSRIMSTTKNKVDVMLFYKIKEKLLVHILPSYQHDLKNSQDMKKKMQEQINELIKENLSLKQQVTSLEDKVIKPVFDVGIK